MNEEYQKKNWKQKIVYLLQNDKKRLMKGGVLGTVGFVLSPLSWWNDLLINFPLAYAFAWLTGSLLRPFMTINLAVFIILMSIGYWITNVAGFILIRMGLSEVSQYRGKLWHDIAIAIVYTGVIVVLALIGASEPVEQTVHLLPSWVER